MLVSEEEKKPEQIKIATSAMNSVPNENSSKAETPTNMMTKYRGGRCECQGMALTGMALTAAVAIRSDKCHALLVKPHL
ncbi:MAG: hypothetical protein PHT15_05185 [Gallionellaceae bacterium]|nr:hypothetical protein [Gallionellaceae bacterium]